MSWQSRPQPLQFTLQVMRHLDLVASGQGPNRNVNRFFPLIKRVHHRFFRTHFDFRHIFQPDCRVVAAGNNQFLELLYCLQIGVGQQINLNGFIFQSAQGRDVIVSLKCVVDVSGSQIQLAQSLRRNPDSHCWFLTGFDADSLDAWQCRQLRLDVS